MIDPKKIPDNFKHPLSSWYIEVQLPNGETENTANLWAFASMITWSCFLRNPDAIELAIAESVTTPVPCSS